MLNKSEIYEAEITDYTAEGQGVAHVEGCAVFVSGAILGERYRLKLTKVAKTWAAGRIEEILVRSPIEFPGPAPRVSAAAAVTSGTWTMRRSFL